MVTLAMLMFPTMLKMNLSRSDAFRASWIFFSCPIDRTRMVRAAKNVLVVGVPAALHPDRRRDSGVLHHERLRTSSSI